MRELYDLPDGTTIDLDKVTHVTAAFPSQTNQHPFATFDVYISNRQMVSVSEGDLTRDEFISIWRNSGA